MSEHLPQPPGAMPPVTSGYPDYPATPQRRTRWRHSAWAAVVVLVACWALGGVAVGVVLVTRPATGCAEDPSIVIDEQARLCYQKPEGWQQQKEQQFTMSITSMISIKPGASGDDDLAMVTAGRWENFFEKAPQGTTLDQGAGSLAASFAEYFFPDPGKRAERTSHEVTIDGHRAGTASFRIDFRGETNPPRYIRCTVVEIQPGQVSFVFGTAPSNQADTRYAVDAIHGSLAVR